MKGYIVHFRVGGIKYACRVFAYSVEQAIKLVGKLGGEAYAVSRMQEAGNDQI